MFIADLHIHSRYSRATSKEGDTAHLDQAARRKGIHLVGTGDFTHPAWRKELSETLIPNDNGFYTLKKEYQLPENTAGITDLPHFVITGEISTIYKKNGKTRKVHSVIILPGLEDAERLSRRLETIGNIHSDGRPILGLDCRDLLEITLDTCPNAIYVPAHIWTPHFSLFGAFSGFNTIEECFEDLSPHIHALETGLSSDPSMNWHLSALDKYQLISNSDAHSPAKLGREATLLDSSLDYQSLKKALETGDGLAGTIEFFPEEGKYHYDGHRNCHLCLSPAQAQAYDNICPVCGKKLTIGVAHRIAELADRPDSYIPEDTVYYESLVPLPEVIASSMGWAITNTKTEKLYVHLLKTLGSEFEILRTIDLDAIRKESSYLLAEGIRRLRSGDVKRSPGYDGVYGTIRLFEPSERNALEGQLSLLDTLDLKTNASNDDSLLPKILSAKHTPSTSVTSPESSLNPEQEKAVITPARALSVIAGPGTGKTKTLVSRILYLLNERHVPPSSITAITFTKKAADEMNIRIAAALNKRQAPKSMFIGTFHAICYKLLKQAGHVFSLADTRTCLKTAEALIAEKNLDITPKTLLKNISHAKVRSDINDEMTESLVAMYQEKLSVQQLLDFDDLLIETLALLKTETKNNFRKKHFDFLFVDEFQDISPLQYALIQAFNKNGTELFVIGDPDQSIYGFRGCDAHCFDQLGQDFPSLVTIQLKTNYRSTPEILKASQALIAHNPGPDRVIQASLPSGKSIRSVHAASPYAESIFIAHEIGKLVGGLDMLDATHYSDEKSLGFSDIAVLYRTHRQAELLETCLRQEGIPCIIAGREDFLNEPSVHGMISFFTYLLDSQNTNALYMSLDELWHIPPEQFSLFTGDLSRIDRSQCSFPYLLEHFQAKKRTAPVKLFEQFIHLLNLTDPACDKLLELSASYKTLSELLDTLTFGEDGDVIRTPTKQYHSDAVHLMTFHASKGLEFPVVFLSHLNQGIVPLDFGNKSTDYTEERRLLYVGMTRAKRQLIFTHSHTPSTFLKEVPEKLIVHEKSTSFNTGKQLDLFNFLN